jgi:hypothetical protein
MPSSRYQIVAQLDPRTMQPIQQPSTGVVQQTQQTQQRGQQQGGQQQGAFNIDRFAAESAADQMNWAAQKGARLTMEDFENARQKAWDAAAQSQREAAMQKQRIQDELQSKVAMSQFEETGKVKRMSDSQIDTMSGYASAGDSIMQLYNAHQEATKVPGYSTAVIGQPAEKYFNVTDPTVRAYNALVAGSLTGIARGVLGDTGVQSSEPTVAKSVESSIPGPGDSSQVGGIKTINLLQKTLTNMGDRIRGMNHNRIDASSAQDDYTRLYNQYKGLVETVGLKSQQEHPVASPNEVFGTPEQQQQFIAKGSQPIQPVVKAGLSQPGQDTIAAVNAAASGQVPGVGGPAPPQAAGGVPSPEQVANLPYNMPQITPEESRPQSMAPGLGTISGAPTDTGRSPAASPSAGINWLQGLLPSDFQTQSEQYVGTGT